MTPTQRKAMEQALKALEYGCNDLLQGRNAADALRAALAEPQGEPYCYTYTENGEEYFAPPTAYVPDNAKPLYTAPQPIPPGWAEAYAAFKGAFDTPLARRKYSSDFAQDARRLLREFNDAMIAAPEAPPPAKRVPLTDAEIDVIVDQCTTDDHGYDIWCDGKSVARAIERAHGIGETK